MTLDKDPDTSSGTKERAAKQRAKRDQKNAEKGARFDPHHYGGGPKQEDRPVSPISRASRYGNLRKGIPPPEQPSPIDPQRGNPDDFLTADEVCEMIGGRRRPISKATLYRLIKLGIISQPEHPSPGISRWRNGKTRAEVDARAPIQSGGCE